MASKLTTEEIIIILDVFEESTKDGLDIKYTLKRLESIFAIKDKADVIDDMGRRIFDFGLIAHGFKGILDENLIEAIAIGDERGHLDVILGEVKKVYELKQNVSEKIKKAVTYPVVVVSLMFGLLILAMIFFIPTIKSFFKGIDPQKIPDFNKFLFAISDFLRGHILIFGFMCIAAVLGVITLFKKYHHVLYRLPVVRQIMITQENATAFLLLSIFHKAGINLQRALESISGSLIGEMGNTFAYAALSLSEGRSISQAFRESSASDDIVIYLEAGETTGKIENAFEKLSRIEIKKLEKKVDLTVKTLNTVLLALGGLSIILFYMLTLLPVYKLAGL
jgi:general secretion pathway protein F